MGERVRATTYGWLTPIWPMTAVGVLVGAMAGGLAAPSISGGSPTATVLIRIDPPIDANQIVTNSAPTAESQQAYLAGEIVYLSSSGFAESVGSELKLPSPPNLVAAQQGQSTLIQITATEPTTDEATAVLDRALKVYAGRITQLASERTGAAIDAITSVIVQVRGDALANAKRDDEPVDQTGLDGKLNQLEQQRLSLQSQQLRAPAIQVIEPITAQSAQSDPSLPIVGGGMLGGLIALAGTLAWRRRSGVIASAAQVDRQVSPVLLPVVRLGRRAGSYARSELSRARTLYGQLPPPRTGEILVVGASSHSGTEVVAKLLYMGAMEHVSVTALSVVGEFANLSAAAVREKLAALPTDEGRTVIIDGGSVASAPQMLAVAERASQIVVVVRIGRDVAAEVEVLLHAIQNEDVPITAIVTKGRLAASEGSSRRKRSDGGRHSLGNRAPADQAIAAMPLPASTQPPQGGGWPVEPSTPWVGQDSWADQPVPQAGQTHGDVTPEPHQDVTIPSPDATPETPDEEFHALTEGDQDSGTQDESADEYHVADADGRPAEEVSVMAPETPADAVPAEAADEDHDDAQEESATEEPDHRDPIVADVQDPSEQSASSDEHRQDDTSGQAQDTSWQPLETPVDETPQETETFEHRLPHEHWTSATLEGQGEPADQDHPPAQGDQHAGEVVEEAHDEHADAQTVEHDAASANGTPSSDDVTSAVDSAAGQDDSLDDDLRHDVNLGAVQAHAQDEVHGEHDGQPHDGQPHDASATPEPPTVQVPLQTPAEQHGENAANGTTAAAVVEPLAGQARSFGTGIRQLLQLRRLPQAQDDEPAETTEPWVSLVPPQGEDAPAQARIDHESKDQSEPSEEHQAHSNGQPRDASLDAAQVSEADRGDGDHQDHHGDQFQNRQDHTSA